MKAYGSDGLNSSAHTLRAPRSCSQRFPSAQSTTKPVSSRWWYRLLITVTGH